MPPVLLRMGRANIQTEQQMHHRRRKPAFNGSPIRAFTAAATLTSGLLMAGQVMAQAPETWVWALYEDGPAPVLAQEIPDTPRLKTTLECDGTSKSVRVVVHGDNALTAGSVTLASGAQSVQSELKTEPGSKSASVRLDHPVFASFTANGALKLEQPSGAVDVTVEQPYLNILRRFSRLCAA